MNFFKEGISEKIVMGAVMLVILAAILIFTAQGEEEKSILAPDSEPVISITEEPDGIAALEKSLEEKIALSLEKMQGVGKVKVLVTYESGLRKEFARDESITRRNSKETDKEGGTRETVEVTENNRIVLDGNTGALIVVEERPDIAGVLVLAEGANDPQIKEQIFLAVRTLLNIQPSKINVAPMGGVLGV